MRFFAATRPFVYFSIAGAAAQPLIQYRDSLAIRKIHQDVPSNPLLTVPNEINKINMDILQEKNPGRKSSSLTTNNNSKREIDYELLDRNRNEARQIIPESFSYGQLGYVQVKLNGVAVNAMIDTGSMSTLISEETADRCGLRRHVDPRWTATGHGIGGKVHSIGRITKCEMKVADSSFFWAVDVYPAVKYDMIIGSDLLKTMNAQYNYATQELQLSKIETIRLPIIEQREILKIKKVKEEQLKMQDLLCPLSST